MRGRIGKISLIIIGVSTILLLLFIDIPELFSALIDIVTMGIVVFYIIIAILSLFEKRKLNENSNRNYRS